MASVMVEGTEALQWFEEINPDTQFYTLPDPLNGKTFAEQLRKIGYEKPIYLASNGDFDEDDFKPHLNGLIGKDVPTFEMIMSWIQK